MTTTWVDAVNTAVSGLSTQVLSLITTNLPIVLGVVIAFLGIRFGKKIINAVG